MFVLVSSWLAGCNTLALTAEAVGQLVNVRVIGEMEEGKEGYCSQTGKKAQIQRPTRTYNEGCHR